MPDERTHPLLQQTALAVNPFIHLPKPPTLPPTYTTLPFSTLPPSLLTPSAQDDPDALPQYVQSSSGSFSAHPSTIIAQNRSLMEQIKREAEEGKQEVEAWEQEIQERELREKRRKAPGWLDREERILEPERKVEKGKDLLGDEGDDGGGAGGVAEGEKKVGEKDVDELGEAMDRAFGRSEMG